MEGRFGLCVGLVLLKAQVGLDDTDVILYPSITPSVWPKHKYFSLYWIIASGQFYVGAPLIS